MYSAAATENPGLQCMICKRGFSKKSSLLRHIKICLNPTSTPRQKSCEWCSTTKSKCDLQWPSCGRCLSRKVSCKYRNPVRRITPSSPSSEPGSECFVGFVAHSPQAPVEDNEFTSHLGQEAPYNTHISQISTIESPTPAWLSSLQNEKGRSFTSLMAHFGEGNEEVEALADDEPSTLTPNLWLQTIAPVVKVLSPLGKHSMEFTFRVLRTWPHMMAGKFQTPPIFHHSQLMKDRIETPLANCFSIAKMWHSQCDKSADFVRDTAVQEMTRLFQNYRKFDDSELLAALQAIVIYVIILLFRVEGQTSISVVDMAILANIQKLVNYVGSVGLVLPEETQHVRPSWEDWVNITSRRRSIFTLYLAHWALSAYYGMPSFDCQELKYMLAPAPKLLWQTKDKEEWISHYHLWLAKWEQHEYLHGEIAEIKPGVFLDSRSEKWLEETDEFGMLVMSLGEKVAMERYDGQRLTKAVNATD